MLKYKNCKYFINIKIIKFYYYLLNTNKKAKPINIEKILAIEINNTL